MSWAEGFLDWTEATFDPFGPAGILVALFVIAYLESSFFPIPPDLLILTFVLNWPELFLVFALVATVGSVLGGLLGYWIGERGGRPLLARLARPDRVDRAEAYFEKWGAWAVGIAGFSPIPYKVFTITAGCLKMDKRAFVEASIMSRGARFFLEASLLYVFRDEIKDFMLGPYFNLATLLGVLGLVGILWGRSKLAEKREAEMKQAEMMETEMKEGEMAQLPDDKEGEMKDEEMKQAEGKDEEGKDEEMVQSPVDEEGTDENGDDGPEEEGAGPDRSGENELSSSNK